MLVPLATAIVLLLACQSPQADRARAEQLARSGQTVEALALFERIRTQNPADLEVLMWIGRLHLRMGRHEVAEREFRAVLLQKPSDIDAIVAYLRTVPPVSNRVPQPRFKFFPSYMWGKFKLLILGDDPPIAIFPGNAGAPGGQR